LLHTPLSGCQSGHQGIICRNENVTIIDIITRKVKNKTYNLLKADEPLTTGRRKKNGCGRVSCQSLLELSGHARHSGSLFNDSGESAIDKKAHMATDTQNKVAPRHASLHIRYAACVASLYSELRINAYNIRRQK
jgi:hypothetical protein